MPGFTDLSPARALLLSLTALAAPQAWSYEDGAPPAHTGGFGEPDCSLCHADNERNPADGRLTLEDRHSAEAGSPRLLVVTLEHPRLRSGGFQLAIRTPEGEPAGRPVPVSDRTRVVMEGKQPYLQHSREGSRPQNDGEISWRFAWSPPEAGEDVVVHVAANAANDDISALGDFTFTLEKTLARERPSESPRNR